MYDYIIVGAGSAGCVLANRLSADPKTKVLLLEAGGSDMRPSIQVPIGYGKTFYDAAVNWKFTSEPIAGMGGRTIYWPRGKVLGADQALDQCHGLCPGAPLGISTTGPRAGRRPAGTGPGVEPYFRRLEGWQGASNRSGAGGKAGRCAIADM